MSETTWLTCSVYSTKQLDQPEAARRVLETITRYDSFVPNRYDYAEPIRTRFEPNDLSKPVALLVNAEANKMHPLDPHGSIWLTRRRKPICDFMVSWSGVRLHPIVPSSYSIDASYTYTADKLQAWLDFCFAMFVEQDAWYGSVALDAEKAAQHRFIYTMPSDAPPSHSPGATVEAFLGTKLYENIPGVYWGTYFGAFYVEWLGQDQFANIPCVAKQWLPNGGVFITTAAHPVEWQMPDAQVMQQKIRQHLGANAFFDMNAVRTTFMQQVGKNNIYDPDQVLPTYRRPTFPFDKTYKARLNEVMDIQREAIVQEQKNIGFTLVGEAPDGVLIFQDVRGDRVHIDQTQKIVHHYPKQKKWFDLRRFFGS